jgi:drug/metabolite transporter (DMT)-like permease
MAVGMAALTPLAAPWSAPWHLLGQDVALGSHRLPGWTLALFIVLISTVLSYLAGAAAIQRLNAPVAAGLAYVEPASATVVAWAALGERLSPAQIAGGLIVLAGAFLAQRGIGQSTGAEPDSAGSILGTTVSTEALI